MDLRQLEYVVAVAEERSFTGAANRCHVVQSTLSAQVARLERELGVTLFERTSRSVRVAPAGELLLPHARALLRRAELARTELAAFSGMLTGQLRLGMVGSAGREVPLIDQTLLAFRRRYPTVDVFVQDTGSRHMADLVRTGDLDLAFVGLYAGQVPPGLVHLLLGDAPLMVVVEPTHPLARRTSVTLGELPAHSTFIDMRAESGLRLQLDDALRRAGVDHAAAFELGTSEAVVRFAGLGFGAGVVPASAVDPKADVAVLAIDDSAARHPIALVHQPPAPANPSARAFLDLLHEAGA